MKTEVQIMRAEVDGISMRYAKFGHGTRTMVILPGVSPFYVTDSGEALATAFQMFLDDWTVYLFDRRDDVRDSYTVEDMATDTLRVMKHLSLGKADIFGASQGGMIALTLALMCPEAVHSMWIGSSSARIPTDRANTLAEWITAAEHGDRTALAEASVSAVYSEKTVIAYRDILTSPYQTLTDEGLIRFSRLCHGCDGYDILSRLPALSGIPMTVVGSEGDRVLGADASREIAEAVRCPLIMYGAEYGHAVYDEATDYRERMHAFFESTYAPESR